MKQHLQVLSLQLPPSIPYEQKIEEKNRNLFINEENELQK